MRSHATVSMIGSASITKPGLTPVDNTATFARFAIASIFFASTRCAAQDSSTLRSVVTIGSFA